MTATTACLKPIASIKKKNKMCIRDRSEVILADTLTMLEIPFLYEAAARLVDEEGREVVLHPDRCV